MWIKELRIILILKNLFPAQMHIFLSLYKQAMKLTAQKTPNETIISQYPLADLRGSDIPSHLKTFVLNETSIPSLSETLFTGHNITNIVISANRKLETIHNKTWADVYNLHNLTIRRNLHLEWPGPGNAIFYTFAGARGLKVLDLEANNITLKGDASKVQKV